MTGKAFWNLCVLVRRSLMLSTCLLTRLPHSWDTLDYMLQLYPHNRGARFLICMASWLVALSYAGVNASTNMLPFGSDLAALWPRFWTIRRGQFLCSLLGVAIVPWSALRLFDL